MMRKVLFFDIDGTLAIHGHIPESNKKALEALKEKGYDTFICTGRAPYYAEKLFGELVSGIISCNGRYISYMDEKLHGVPFTPVEVEELKKKLDNLGCGGLFVSDTFSSPYHLEGDVLTHVKKEYGEEHIKDDAYAFGDGYNDQAMFREAGQRIAMGNGVDVLKEKATYITDTVDNEGIYKALKHYELL